MTGRRVIVVEGVVQGVGFRPHVHALATALGLGGVVRNRPDGVWIEIEGERGSLDRFVEDLRSRPPALARIVSLRSDEVMPRGEHTFRIDTSDTEMHDGAATGIAPDVGTCAACARELADPSDRRHGYAFLNCTECGPRFTIIEDLPYDRARTTMSPFAMCDACRREHDAPDDRRFHAQPIACPACGPRLRALDARGRELAAGDPIAWAAAQIQRGLIVAIKGLGGFHVACDASREDAVGALRARKARIGKPFAVMVADLEAARALCELGAEHERELTSPARPIVLAPMRESAGVAASVAPALSELGLMLPYTPLHHLLARAMRGAPLVMTSGNRTDEPIAYRDEDAPQQLAGIADAYLTHDRRIHMRTDDSVVRVVGGAATLLRRARGIAPLPLSLGAELAVPTLAVGGQMKSTFALGHGSRAIVSHHLGDLHEHEAYRAFLESIAHYERLYRVVPRRIAYDMHPDYTSTRYALERAAAERGMEAIAVQHHHAHMAACLAEHGARGRAIGVCFDGTGYGMDGTVWGGELLVGDTATFARAAHLRRAPMPGASMAIREPWRMGVAHLLCAGLDPERLFRDRIPARELRAVTGLARRAIDAGAAPRTPWTSSAGRLFDAIASILGLCDRASFDGEAAMRLEALTSEVEDDRAYACAIAEADEPGAPHVIDTRPLVASVVGDADRGIDVRLIACRFHAALARATADACTLLGGAFGVSDIALSGGVFVNRPLVRHLEIELAARSFRVLRHRALPPNDGGLSFGQLAVAAGRDA